MNDTILPRSFYARDPILVGQELLGKILVRVINGKVIKGRITETESYLVGDPAAHSFIGKTKRNEAMFGKAGKAYIYSMHRYHCFNVVTEDIDLPSGVLIRSLDIVTGPGRLCMLLQIDKSLYGVDVTNKRAGLYIVDDGYKVDKEKIIKSPRVGISKAKEALLRFRLLPTS